MYTVNLLAYQPQALPQVRAGPESSLSGGPPAEHTAVDHVPAAPTAAHMPCGPFVPLQLKFAWQGCKLLLLDYAAWLLLAPGGRTAGQQAGAAGQANTHQQVHQISIHTF